MEEDVVALEAGGGKENTVHGKGTNRKIVTQSAIKEKTY